jgi:predicted phosphodiesterase
LSECIRIIQVGDIHLPEWDAKSKHQDLDGKDPSYSPYILDDIKGLDNISTVLRRLAKLAQSQEISAITFMGDFTSWGGVDRIEDAIEIFDALTTRFDGTQASICGVTGNHDVAKVDALTLGDTSKFDPIQDAMKRFGWNPPPISGVEKFPIAGKKSNCDAILINTSIGSWSPHLFPDLLEAEFQKDRLKEKALKLTMNLTGDVMPLGELLDDQSFETREEQLFAMDVPYISRGTKNELAEIISESDEKDTHLIIGHHNILPQRTTRVTPYGELLNSGMFRRYLQNTDKNIIYLHGHIHDDPVEIIGVPSFAKGTKAHSQPSTNKIVTISAPPIWQGFNEIALFLDANDDIYLLRITKYRLDENMEIGNFSNQDSVYIPIMQNALDLSNSDSRKVMRALEENRGRHNPTGIVKWADLVDYLQKSNANIDEDELEHSILRLFCGGVVLINNLGRERNRWSIQLKTPEAQ